MTETEIRAAEPVAVTVLTEKGVSALADRMAWIRHLLIAAFMIIAGMTIPERISETSQIGPISTSDAVGALAYSIALGLIIHLIASTRVFRRFIWRNEPQPAAATKTDDNNNNGGGGGGTYVYTIDPDDAPKKSFPWWLLIAMALFVGMLLYAYLKVEVFGE